MDEETYEQIQLPRGDVEDELAFLEPSSTVQLLTVDGRPAGIQLPLRSSSPSSKRSPGSRGTRFRT